MNTELSVRIKTAVIIVLVMLAFLIPGYWLPFIPLILFLAITFYSSLEKGNAVSRRMPDIDIRSSAIASVLIIVPMLFVIPDGWFVRGIPEARSSLAPPIVAPTLISVYTAALLIFSALWILISALRKGVESLPFSIFETFIVISSSVPLAAVITLFYAIPNGFFWVLLAIFTPWLSDTFSYFTGSLLGANKMATKISKQKTWEGTLGGIVGTWIFYLLYFPLLLGPKLGLNNWAAIVFAIVAGLVMSLVSTAGDLFASSIKRWCRIKDFGSILPGHGGITDRFDSMTWTMPAILILALLTHSIL